MNKGNAWFVFFMLMLALGIVAGTGYAVFMTFTHLWVWVIPALIGCWGVYHMGGFFVAISDPTNGSK